MPSETLVPDGLLENSSHSSCVLSDLTSDPDAGDANWCVASNNNTSTAVRVSFPTPSANPTVGADLQEFRAQVRQTSGSGTGIPTARIELFESGSLIRAGSDVNVTATPTTSQVIAFTWNANEIAGANGANVELKVVTTKSGGSPSARSAVDTGGAEWNATVDAASTTYTKAIAGGVTGVGSPIKQTSVFYGGSATATGTIIKQTSIFPAGSLTATGALSPVPTFVLAIGGSLTATGAVAGALLLIHSISGSSTMTGDPSTVLTIVTTLDGTSTPSGIILKSVGYNVGGSISGAGGILKQVLFTLTGSATLTGVLANVITFVQSLTGSSTGNATLAAEISQTQQGPFWRRFYNRLIGRREA